jgi:TonB-linked SusC/RagA family outer membrane protein
MKKLTLDGIGHIPKSCHAALFFGIIFFTVYPSKKIQAGDFIRKWQNAQQKEVKGKVTNESGEPLVGATVAVDNTTIQTTTNSNGEFSLSVPDNAILVISYLGYVNQRIGVGSRTHLDVIMVLANQALGEVVVVGYGTQKKRDIIGSVSTVNSKDLQTKNFSSFESALQGLAAGVSVQTQSGVPGAPTRILIRGASSINSSTDPLWIIDGVPIFADDFTQNYGTTSQSPLSLINQNDIESIQVLKDAAATSIYGSRAANGVIIVTTKTGKGKGITSIDYSTGISDLTRKPSDIGYVNTQQWFQALDRLYLSAGRPFTMDDYYQANRLAFTRVTRAQVENINTDWFDLLFRKSTFQDINISSSKASEGTQFYISGNYRKDNGVQIQNSLQRASIRSNLDFNPTGIFSVGMKANLSYTINSRQQNNGFVNTGGGGINGGLNAVTGASMPWYPVYDFTNPNKYFNPYSGANPMAYADPKNLKDELTQYRGIGSIYANLKIPFVKGLSLRTELSADFLQSNSIFYNSPDVYWDATKTPQAPNSFASDQAVTRRTVNYNGYATLDRSFGEHNVIVVAGAEATRTDASFRGATGKDLVGTLQQLGSPGTILSAGSGFGGERYLGAFFGRANYKFKDRYLLGLSARRDGSSAFGKDYRWGNFIAYSAGWIISEEPFMNFLGGKTFIKLRGSYGETGNQNVPGSLDQPLYISGLVYGGTNILGVNGTLPANVPVKDITWETTKSTDVGIDFGFLNNRINGSIAYYNKNVVGMLLTAPVPLSAGIGGSNTIWGNLGNMSNTGVELEVHSTNFTSKNFRWITDFNVAFNSNKVKKLTPDADQTGKGLIQDVYYISRKGEKRRQWYLSNYVGIDPQLGVPMIQALDTAYYNATGKTRVLKNSKGQDSLLYGTITNINSNKFIQEGKSPDPTYYGGITNTFQYKGFELSFLISFSGGNYIYDYSLQSASAVGPQKQFLSEVYAKSWRGPGDNTAEYPQMRIGGLDVNGTIIADFAELNTYNTKWLYKGDYVRLRNVRFAYNLPNSLTKRIGLQGVNFSVTGTNLWTGTDYRGFDPEGATFIRTATIPQLKSVILGLSVKF